MYSIYYCNKFAFNSSNIYELKHEIHERLNLSENDYYILQNGKRLQPTCISDKNPLHIVPKLIGGKGGFGSMLRAIGAQIEKTTNREACRDLSGRRLRDINEEKRLKTWIEQQVEREKEAKDRKQKKLERLVQIPKHEFKDESYEKDRSALPDMVEDALEQGLKASTSMGNKRAHDEENKKLKKKKPKLWLGSDEELSSSSEIDSENEETKVTKQAEQKNEDSCSSSNTEQKEENSNSSKEQTQDEAVEEKQEEKTEIPCTAQIEVKCT